MSSPTRIPMTPEGKARLEATLKELKSVTRPALMAAIEEARGHGDLRENAEYHSAKDKQGLVVAQMAMIEDKLSRAQVIDPAELEPGGKVSFGMKVTLRDKKTDEEVVYRIVGAEEADVKQGLIAYDAPLARALFGKEEGDDVKFEAPKGVKTFEILSVDVP